MKYLQQIMNEGMWLLAAVIICLWKNWTPMTFQLEYLSTNIREQAIILSAAYKDAALLSMAVRVRVAARCKGWGDKLYFFTLLYELSECVTLPPAWATPPRRLW